MRKELMFFDPSRDEIIAEIFQFALWSQGRGRFYTSII
jgi:hypothetical protein